MASTHPGGHPSPYPDPLEILGFPPAFTHLPLSLIRAAWFVGRLTLREKEVTHVRAVPG
jgi:hypothetical protein